MYATIPVIYCITNISRTNCCTFPLSRQSLSIPSKKLDISQWTLLFVFILDFDECASRPCRHGGECIDHVSKYTCTCMAGYVGTVCEIGKSYIIIFIFIYKCQQLYWQLSIR